MEKENVKIQKVVFGLVMLFLWAPSAGFCATQTYTFVNNCNAPVSVTVQQYHMTESGEIRGTVVPRNVGTINTNGSTSFDRPSGNLTPVEIDASYYSGTSPLGVIPLKCAGTPVQCIQSFTVTFKMNGTVCLMTSNQSVWQMAY
jgi:hypothetical protein